MRTVFFVLLWVLSGCAGAGTPVTRESAPAEVWIEPRLGMGEGPARLSVWHRMEALRAGSARIRVGMNKEQVLAELPKGRMATYEFHRQAMDEKGETWVVTYQPDGSWGATRYVVRIVFADDQAREIWGAVLDP